MLEPAKVYVIYGNQCPAQIHKHRVDSAEFLHVGFGSRLQRVGRFCVKRIKGFGQRVGCSQCRAEIKSVTGGLPVELQSFPVGFESFSEIIGQHQGVGQPADGGYIDLEILQ